MAGLNFGFRFITVLLVTGNVLQCIAVLPPYLPVSYNKALLNVEISSRVIFIWE